MRVTVPSSIFVVPAGTACLVAGVLLCGMLAGCLSPPQQFAPKVAELAFLSHLKERVTTRQELETRLGEPTIRFAGGRILGYELLFFSKYGSFVAEPFFLTGTRRQSEYLVNTGRMEVFHHNPSTPDYAWSRVAEWSLIAVFDEQDRLKAYRIVPVMPLPSPKS